MLLKRPTVRSDSRRRKICTSTATHKSRDATGKVTPASLSLCLTTLLIVESMNCGRTCRVTKGVAQSKFSHDSLCPFFRLMSITACLATKDNATRLVYIVPRCPFINIVDFHPHPRAISGVGRASTPVSILPPRRAVIG